MNGSLRVKSENHPSVICCLGVINLEWETFIQLDKVIEATALFC